MSKFLHLRMTFLAIGDTIIKVREGKMIMRVKNEETVFNVYQVIQLPRHYEDVAMIFVLEVDEPILGPSEFKDDVLEETLMFFQSNIT